MTAATRVPRVVLRCNAGGTTGLGHLSRCLTLADALADRGARCLFALPHEARDVSQRVDARGHRSELLDARDPEADLGALASQLEAAPADWLVVDHYDADGAYLERAAGLVADGHLAVLDDTGERDLSAVDLVVNPSPGADAWTPIGAATTLLSGPAFALLAPTWRQAASAFALRDRVARVAIYLGGATTVPMLREACRAVRHHLAPDEVVAVAPDGVLAQLDHGDADRVEHRLTPDEMARLFASADVAVVTPSTIAWEVACIGVPAVFVQTVGNQDRVAAFLDGELGTVTRPGHVDALLSRRDLSARTARAGLREQMRGLTDGLGAERVADHMLAW